MKSNRRQPIAPRANPPVRPAPRFCSSKEGGSQWGARLNTAPTCKSQYMTRTTPISRRLTNLNSGSRPGDNLTSLKTPSPAQPWPPRTAGPQTGVPPISFVSKISPPFGPPRAVFRSPCCPSCRGPSTEHHLTRLTNLTPPPGPPKSRRTQIPAGRYTESHPNRVARNLTNLTRSQGPDTPAFFHSLDPARPASRLPKRTAAGQSPPASSHRISSLPNPVRTSPESPPGRRITDPPQWTSTGYDTNNIGTSRDSPAGTQSGRIRDPGHPPPRNHGSLKCG